jgi:flagellar motor switch protein FliG
MQLAGRTKATILLLSLPQGEAVNIVNHLSEEELRALRTTAEELGPVTTPMLREVYEDFATAFKAGLTTLQGSSVYLQDLVRKAHGEEEAVRLFAAPVALPPSEPQRPLGALEGADAGVLAAALSAEHPQVAAAVVAHLESVLAAAVVGKLSPAQQCDVLRRVSKLTNVPAAAFTDAARALGDVDLGEQPRGDVDGLAAAAQIIKSLPVATADELLDRLSEEHPDEAGRVRRAMFTFNDLIETDQRSLQALMREVQSDTLLVALKTASEELRGKFFACMSARAAEMLREELDLMPPVRLAEVEQAQEQIVEIATRLGGEGKMSVGSRGEEMV